MKTYADMCFKCLQWLFVKKKQTKEGESESSELTLIPFGPDSP